jgi:hypothetical protein
VTHAQFIVLAGLKVGVRMALADNGLVRAARGVLDAFAFLNGQGIQNRVGPEIRAEKSGDVSRNALMALRKF